MSPLLSGVGIFGIFGAVAVVVIGGALREHRRAFLQRQAERPDATWWELAE